MSLFEIHSLEEFDELFKDQKDLILSMIRDNLLIEAPPCTKCFRNMHLRTTAGNIHWRCCDEMNPLGRRCVRLNSWFSRHPNIPLNFLVKAILFYSKGFSANELLLFQSQIFGRNIQRPYLLNLISNLEDVCSGIVASYEAIGGFSVPVELRETTVTVRQDGNSSLCSVLVGVEPSSGRCFAQALKEKTSEEMEKVLLRWVMPESLVNADPWRIGGDAIDDLISRIKSPVIRQPGWKLQSYLDEFVVRSTEGRHFFGALLSEIQLIKKDRILQKPLKTSCLLKEAISSFVSHSQKQMDKRHILIENKAPSKNDRKRKIEVSDDVSMISIFKEEPAMNNDMTVVKMEEDTDEKDAVNAVSLLNEDSEEKPGRAKKRLTGRYAVSRLLSHGSDSPSTSSDHPFVKVPPNVLLVDIRFPEQLDECCPTELDLAVMMMEQNFLPRDPPCFNCGRIMTLRLRGKLGETMAEWRCRDTRFKRDCSCRSVRTGSWFSSSAMPLKTMLKMLIMWANGEANTLVSTALKISLSTVTTYREMFKDVCVRVANAYEIMGGAKRRMEVAQYLVETKKFGRGVRVAEVNIVIVGVDLETNQCFIELETTHNEQKILNALKKWIRVGTTVNGVVFDGITIPSLDGGENTQQILCEIQPSKLLNMTSNVFPGYIAETMVRHNEGDDFQKKVMSFMMCGQSEALPPMDRASSKRNNGEATKQIDIFEIRMTNSAYAEEEAEEETDVKPTVEELAALVTQ